MKETPRRQELDGLMGVFSDNAIRLQIVKDPQLDPLSWQPRDHAQRILDASTLLDATSTDLGEFQRQGGKLIHGTEDPMLTPYGTIDYYNQLVARYGAQALGASVKFYLVLGFSHGAGTFYSRIETIREEQNPSTRGRTGPVCQWPAYPVYKGQGDPNAWQSFDCKQA